MNTSRNLIIISVLLVGICTFFLVNGDGDRKVNSSTDGLQLYCAAGMEEPIEAIRKMYQDEYGIPIQVQYGGSGTLLSNIKIAKTGDLYLAADESYLMMAKDAGLIQEIIPLSNMEPVIAVPKGNPKGIYTIEDLIREDVDLGLANPDAAAVGKSTRKILEESGHWSRIEEKTEVFKPTVMDLATDVKLKTIDASILWDAVVHQYPELETVSLPELAKGRTLVSVGVMTSARNPTDALRFARYMSAVDRGLPEFAESGFTPIEGDKWSEKPKVVLYSGGVNRLAIEETLEEFAEREGIDLVRSFNGCGILVAQMKAGEVPDAYFACDVSFINNVPELFPSSVDLSETKVVILVEKGNPKGIKTLADLGQQGLKIGMTNPEQSALGKLSTILLESEGLYDEVSKNIAAQGPTADLLVNMMQTGALDAALVYEANTAMVRDKLEIVYIDSPKARAVQPYGIADQSDNKQIMNRLLETLQTDSSREKFEEVGFDFQASQVGP